MAEMLRPEGTDIYLGDVRLRTPGLTGRAELHLPQLPGTRAIEATTEDFLQSLRNSRLTEQFTIEIADHRELDARGGTRALGGESAIVADVPGPGSGYGQLLLYVAEDGSVTWHLAENVPAGQARTRGAERRTYRIPRPITPTPTTPGQQRGLVGAVGKKLLKVLVFPLIDPALGAIGAHFAAKWEQEHRRDVIRTFTPESYRNPDVNQLTMRQWNDLSKGPALLFVHGTMSQSHTAFRRIPADLMTKLFNNYAGRVFAFDHPTVTVSPTSNAEWFAEQLPPGLELVVDIISHSRGGLVSRALAERPKEVGLNGNLLVRNLVMVGTPNAGTALADVAHVQQLLDRVTGLVQFIPDNGVTDTLDILLTVLKQLAVGAVKGLDGLMAMNPAGDYLRAFNHTPGCNSVYRAIASNYEPASGSPLSRIARDEAADIIFGKAGNDLIVPTEGVYTVPGAHGFPIAEPLVFAADEAVDHSSYWTQKRFASTILQWLSGP